MGTSPPPIMGVAEVVLNVDDLPAMRAFYREVLGFVLHSEVTVTGDPEPADDDEATITFLTVSDADTPLGRHGHPQLLVLIDYRRHAFAKGRYDNVGAARSTLNHLAFEIPPDAYDAHAERLESLGFEVTRTAFPTMSAKALFFEDPERNLLELICHAVPAG